MQGLAQRLGTTGNSLYSFAKGKSVLHVRTLRAAVELINRVCPDEMDEFIHQTTAHFGWICAPLQSVKGRKRNSTPSLLPSSPLPTPVIAALHDLQIKAETDPAVQRLLINLNQTLSPPPLAKKKV